MTAIETYVYDDLGYATITRDNSTVACFAYDYDATCDSTAAVAYYGYRYYNPELGRWVNRDPLGDHASPGARILHGEIASRISYAALVNFQIALNEELEDYDRIIAILNALYWINGIQTLHSGDPSIGLRWFDPFTGRWLSKDPIGISGGLNQYVFCGNDPVMFVDPFGLSGNPISGGGTDIYYPHGGWGSVNMPGATFEHRTTFGFANAYRMSEPVLVSFGAGAVVVGGAAAVYYGAPYVIAGGAAVLTTGQNAFYRLMSSQPMSVLDRMILYYPQSPPARATVAELWNSVTPYASQIGYGIAPGPGGPFANRGEALSWMTGWGIGQAYETLQSDCPPDK